MNKFTLPGYDGSMIIDAEYENGDVTQVRSRATKVVDPKELVADMLQQIVHNGVDDDLIEAATNMVDLVKWFNTKLGFIVLS